MTSKLISVIVPVYSEEKVVEQCYQRIKQVFDKLENYYYELIFIDDGSTDSTVRILKELARNDPRIKILCFSRNFGHQAALTAGLLRISGDAAFILDADLQDPPEVLPAMIAKFAEGYDLVYGVRKRRQDRLIKKTIAFLYYRLLSHLSEIPLARDSGDFCLMSKNLVEKINSLPEKNRYLRGIRSWVGFRQIGIEYERGQRLAGQPGYSFFKSLKLGLDGVVSFSLKPLKLAVMIGFVFTVLAMLMILYGLWSYFFRPERTITGWASTFIAVVFFAGIQLLTLGIMGEYIGRIFDEVKNRPMFIVKEEINFD